MKIKNLLLAFILLLMANLSFGQINKGSVLLGGDISAYTTTQTSNGQKGTDHGFTFSPLVGKAIKANFIFGGFLTLAFTHNGTVNAPYEFKQHSYGAGFFLRKYAVIRNDFYYFFQGNLGASYNKMEFFSNSNSTSINRNIMASLSPGISYKVSRRMHLETGFRDIININYSNQETNNDNAGIINKSKSNMFSISSSLNNFTSSFYFGFRFLIGNKEG